MIELIIAIVFEVLLISWFKKSTYKNTGNLKISNNNFVLEHSLKTILFYVSIFSFGPLLILFLLFLDVGAADFIQWFLYSFCALLFFVIGLYFSLSLNREKVFANKDYLQRTYVLKDDKIIYWNTLKNIIYAKTNKYLIFKSNNDEAVRVSYELNGFSSFCEAIKPFIKEEKFIAQLDAAINDVKNH